VQRPKDAEQQKEHYSGKKKRHTRKHVTGQQFQIQKVANNTKLE
jgi:hypothetical protein